MKCLIPHLFCGIRERDQDAEFISLYSLDSFHTPQLTFRSVLLFLFITMPQIVHDFLGHCYEGRFEITCVRNRIQFFFATEVADKIYSSSGQATTFPFSLYVGIGAFHSFSWSVKAFDNLLAIFFSFKAKSTCSPKSFSKSYSSTFSFLKS